ncbi:hypothetical protein [Streptomyces sp. NPDC126499]|uniref:hypothetical protein n=1 Tax=Streptomyces sp. NPDC126499 TaxID=3155314 RepID=UPI0033251DF5
MREHDIPDRAGNGSDGPPVYPGESTDTPTGTTPGSPGTGSGTATGTEAFAGADPYGGTETYADTETGGETTGTTGTGMETDTTTDTDTTTATAPETDTAAGTGTARDEGPQLLDPSDDEEFRARWSDIQSQFVDDPRGAVHAADSLVADVMRKLAETFADHKRNLEGQWSEGEDVDTEGLRTALRQYRSFFNRLLTR